MVTLIDGCLPYQKFRKPIFIEDFRRGIPLSGLPRTFQDAIFVTRKLGVRFLWIDSLCIIQNSPADWDEESEKMRYVYGDAYVTLAATASQDSTGGLFYERDPSLASPVKVTPTWKDTSSEDFVVVPQSFWVSAVSLAPLNQRAWALQERLLSPRVIHFGRNQIYWECRSMDRCEMFPNALPATVNNLNTRFKAIDFDADGPLLRKIADNEAKRSPFNNDHTQNLKEKDDSGETMFRESKNSADNHKDEKHNAGEGCGGKDSSMKSGDIIDSCNDLTVNDEIEGTSGQRTTSGNDDGLNGYYIWSRLLEKYCRTRLTFEKDKLVAISSLAQLMQTRLHDQYVLGLWKRILPSQLLWRVEDYNQELNDRFAIMHEDRVYYKPVSGNRHNFVASRPEVYRAPSWSWASIEGPIVAPRPETGGYLCHAEPVHTDRVPKCETEVPCLMVTGDLHRAILIHQRSLDVWYLRIEPRGMRVLKPQDSDDNTRAPLNYSKFNESTNDMTAEHCCLARAFPDVELDERKVLCVPVMKSKQKRALRCDGYPSWCNDAETVSGLMLQSTENQGVYTRVGVFDMFDGEEAFLQKEYRYRESNRQYFLQSPEERFSDKVFAIV
ncbi:MAG: hypothetical protein LQ350_003085 [Teloschistes chrysophthalmus]|nr:MAG: hypothetical protein LQ350_003085 [Niorma chrysophthalma]